MKNSILKISALMLSACTAMSILSSCDKKPSEQNENVEPSAVTKISTKAETVINDEGNILEIATINNDYTIYNPQTKRHTNAYTYAINEDSSYNIAQPSDGSQDKPEDTKNNKPLEKIEEKSNGISLITKSNAVLAGNSATVMIQGNPGKKYSIDFYKTSSEKASYSGLEEKTADDAGLVTWTFNIDESCEKGNRKIYIKEKNSSNYIQTYITVS